jgi:hypothetical protein
MKTALFTYPNYGTPESYPELAKRSGQNVTVIRKLTFGKEMDEEVEPMYAIKFEDGLEHEAYESELTFIE